VLRITAAALLAVIAWGSTVEVTHGHSATDTNLKAEKTLNCATLAADELATPTVHENRRERSSSRPNPSSECLICQLHHNLATTLLAELASVDALHTQSSRSLARPLVHLFEFSNAQRGRAPPVIL